MFHIAQASHCPCFSASPSAFSPISNSAMASITSGHLFVSGCGSYSRNIQRYNTTQAATTTGAMINSGNLHNRARKYNRLVTPRPNPKYSICLLSCRTTYRYKIFILIIIMLPYNMVGGLQCILQGIDSEGGIA